MDDYNKEHYGVSVKKLPHSQIEIKAAIPATEFDGARAGALKHIGADAELPGFRRGHVPEKILAQRVGEAAILEEMAEVVIGRAYPKIIIGEKLDVIGRPKVAITKIAPGNPLEFTIEVAVAPEFTLPDYKSIAMKTGKKDDVATVSNEELSKMIDEVRRMHAPEHKHEEGEKDGEHKEILPELTDEFVNTLGNFTNVEDFKTKLKENLQKEKERDVKEKRRIAILDAIIAKTDIDLPEIIVDEELTRIEDEFAANIKRMGLEFDKYLEAVKKTKEEMRKEWRPDAEKRAKIELVIGKIAETEKMSPDDEKLKKEIAQIESRYPDAPKERVRGYVTMVHMNQRVIEWLENS